MSPISNVQVLVPEGEAKDLMEASAADALEVGPFQVLSFTLHRNQPLTG